MSGCRAEPSQWPIAGYGARMSELPPEESKPPSPGDFPAAVRNPREVLLFGITPPRAETAPERISEIAARTLARVEALPVDALVLYDITDEADRNAAPRPFPFASMLDPGDYLSEQLAGWDRPAIVYRAVGKYREDELADWLAAAPDNVLTVFVGSSSSDAEVSTTLPRALELHREVRPSLPLGGVTIPERHSGRGDEHERLLAKESAGASFFITQVIYDVDAAKKISSAIYGDSVLVPSVDTNLAAAMDSDSSQVYAGFYGPLTVVSCSLFATSKPSTLTRTASAAPVIATSAPRATSPYAVSSRARWTVPEDPRPSSPSSSNRPSAASAYSRAARVCAVAARKAAASIRSSGPKPSSSPGRAPFVSRSASACVSAFIEVFDMGAPMRPRGAPLNPCFGCNYPQESAAAARIARS